MDLGLQDQDYRACHVLLLYAEHEAQMRPHALYIHRLLSQKRYRFCKQELGLIRNRLWDCSYGTFCHVVGLLKY